MTIIEKYKGKMIKKVGNTGISKEEYDSLTNQIEEMRLSFIDALRSRGVAVNSDTPYDELIAMFKDNKFYTKTVIGENVLFNDNSLRSFTGATGATSTLFNYELTTFYGDMTLTFNAWGGYTGYSPKCYVDVVRDGVKIYSYSHQTTDVSKNILSYDLYDLKIGDVIKITLEARYPNQKVQRLQDIYIKGDIF